MRETYFDSSLFLNTLTDDVGGGHHGKNLACDM